MEKRVQEMGLLVQKLERDIGFKDEELKSLRNIARDMAEQMEPVERVKREKDREMEGMRGRMEEDIRGLRAEVDEGKRREEEMGREIGDRVDREWRMGVEIEGLRAEIGRMREEMRGKDELVGALSNTLVEKGEENRKMAEKMTEIKNHYLET